MNAYKKLTCIGFILYCIFLAGCSLFKSQENTPKIYQYKSYKEIPGVTADEILSIESLQKQVNSFTYGMTPSAEAFYENNKINGFSTLLCNWLTELFGIPFSPEFYIWNDLVAGLETGKIDFTGELTATNERRKTYFMTDPIASRTLIYFRLYGSMPLSEISKNRPLQFAILKNTTIIDEVSSSLDKNTFEIILLDNTEKVYDMLKSGKIDAYINENPEEAIFDAYWDVISEIFLPFVYSPVSLSTQNPKLEPVISVFQKAIKNDKQKYLTELYNRGYQEYQRYKLSNHLTEEEQEYIQNHSTILFGAEFDNYPVSFYNKYDKAWQGIFIDVLKETEKLTGLSFKINNDQADFSKLLQMLEKGEISIISELIRSEEREGRFLWPKKALFSDKYALLSKWELNNIKINDILHLRIGIIKDTAHSVWFQKSFPSHKYTTKYDNTDIAFTALEGDDTDMLMSRTSQILNLTNYHELTGYKVNYEFDVRYESKLGLNKNEVVLCSIIDKSLRLIDIEFISRQWMNKSFDYHKKLTQEKQYWFFGASILILCIAILLYVLFQKTKNAGKKLTSLVQKRTAELESVSNNYKGVIWSINKEGIITTFKGRNTKIFEPYHKHIEGTKLRSDEQNIILQSISENVQKTFLEGPQDWINKENNKVYHSYTTPIYETKGKIIGVVGSTDDVTETINLQEAAQAASRAKSDFLSHISHEIRTPLNAIIGMIRIGMGTDEIEKKNYCFERTNSASRHLLSLINDILDISKIEANKFELLYTEFDFELMLKNITNMSNIRAEEKNQSLIVNLDKDVPAFILGDELRLSQVITNLLSNSIKFTPEKGTIILGINKTDEINGEATLRIEIADNGIGISKDQQKRLFSPFNQADANISQKFGGTGLGLAISKRIVELMGGTIWIESDLGKGAKFIFTIKVKNLEEKSNKKLSANIKTENVHILAITDPAEKDYFIYIMEVLKLSCDFASGGNNAIDLIKNASKPYNLFFIDGQMPDMDGIELTKKIKEINNTNSVIIMTSMANWNSIEKKAQAAGIDHFISKPLFPSAIINAINSCIGDLQKTKTNTQDKPAKQNYNFCGHTLLIAEDVEINREIMSAILEETKVSCEFATDGKMAVCMFSEHPEKYSLILMDINMPEMDGHAATKTIRSLDLSNAKDIPIIAMTANVFKEDIEKCIASGMNDHTGKPIDAEALFKILDNYLKNLHK